MVISEVKMNKACTVAHVWWNTAVPLSQEQDRKVTPDIQRMLTRAKGYLAGKLVNILGLRYAPELRFYIDRSDEEYIELISQLTERKTMGGPNQRLLEEIHVLRTWSPARVEQMRGMIKDEKARAQFDEVVGRRNLIEREAAAKKEETTRLELEEYLSAAPKKSKHKLKKIEKEKQLQELAIRRGGLDPKMLNEDTADPEDVAEEIVANSSHRIPSKKKPKQYDANGKRVRNHQRDESGKKVKKPKKDKAKQFWEGLDI